MALRRYFEAHLAIKVEQVKQSLQRTEGGAPIHSQPYYKVCRRPRTSETDVYTFLNVLLQILALVVLWVLVQDFVFCSVRIVSLSGFPGCQLQP